jgi:hypothetical protein
VLVARSGARFSKPCYHFFTVAKGYITYNVMLEQCACRVGRTGRAGDKEGVAVTLLLENTNRDTHFAGLLVNSLTLGGQQVPNSLYALAMKVRGDGWV